MGAYLACLSLSVRHPFPSRGGGRLCPSVVYFAGQGGIKQVSDTLVGKEPLYI